MSKRNDLHLIYIKERITMLKQGKDTSAWLIIYRPRENEFKEWECEFKIGRQRSVCVSGATAMQSFLLAINYIVAFARREARGGVEMQTAYGEVFADALLRWMGGGTGEPPRTEPKMPES